MVEPSNWLPSFTHKKFMEYKKPENEKKIEKESSGDKLLPFVSQEFRYA